jgi:four helix bundle protein
MNHLFDHERLEVYQRSIEFAGWAGEMLEKLPKSSALSSQLDRASISIPLNIAEGNGKWTKKDRCRFFDIAKGSALESAAGLDAGVARKFISEERAIEGKTTLAAIVRMLIGLIQANDPDRKLEQGSMRVGEGLEGYLMENEKE